MRISITQLVFAYLLVSIFACRKPYAPTIITTNRQYLVVEGTINSGADSTLIKLSRTVTLSSPTKNPERGARIIIESDKNDQYTLKETSARLGYYVIANLNLPADRRYRLHIFTSQNKEYVSDYVENKITPPIDSVYATPLVTGVQFSVSSHDNNNKTRYYRWDYNETWRYNVGGPHPSLIVYKDGQILSRNPDSLISDCYKNATPSNSIFLANSNKLVQDVISKYPLGYVDGSTGKITNVYSLLVKQYALTPDAYRYWELLKKNTEQLGSIDDAQPSSSLTNIHAVNNSGEPAIGYVSVSTVATKRIFLSGRTLPFAVNQHAGDTVSCGGGIITINPTSTLTPRLNRTLAAGDSLLIEVAYDKMGKMFGYTYGTSICVDCRLRGGTNKKPSYWPTDL
jgi:hypothetical protein